MYSARWVRRQAPGASTEGKVLELALHFGIPQPTSQPSLADTTCGENPSGRTTPRRLMARWTASAWP